MLKVVKAKEGNVWLATPKGQARKKQYHATNNANKAYMGTLSSVKKNKTKKKTSHYNPQNRVSKLKSYFKM